MPPRPSPSTVEAVDADRALLARRLTELGVRGVREVVVHANRSVMLRHGRDGVLRIHRGYAYAPDAVLAAVVAFVRPRSPRTERRTAKRALLAFPVHDFVPAARRPRSAPRPGDAPTLERLRLMHRRLNVRYFGGTLGTIPFRLSSRMSTRLGDVRLDPTTSAAVEIAISRHHIARDGWEAVERTVLHELVHQWQAERGLPVDHGPAFRRKARAVGIAPRARAERMPAARPAPHLTTG
ncbi:MAG TPA: SprT-like domain-containing protein [Gemmatimonadales bacterium]|nr:SprT-like domain-containing protein [Gemmatimonadales bacterium]